MVSSFTVSRYSPKPRVYTQSKKLFSFVAAGHRLFSTKIFKSLRSRKIPVSTFTPHVLRTQKFTLEAAVLRTVELLFPVHTI